VSLRWTLALAPLVIAACGVTPPEPPANLVVISIDTLRADHMSLHGYPRRTTPRIEAFAAEAVTFEQARAPWPKTVPSMVSMFTSRPPHVTGVMFGSRDQYVPDEELMLAEIARAQGLRTAGVVSNAVLGASSNFGQGFETYTETYREVSGPVGSRGDTVTAAAERWLADRPAGDVDARHRRQPLVLEQLGHLVPMGEGLDGRRGVHTQAGEAGIRPRQ